MYASLLSEKDQRTLIRWFCDNLADSETLYSRPLTKPADIGERIAHTINPLFYVRSWVLGEAFTRVGKAVGAAVGLYILYRGEQKYGIPGIPAAAAAEVGFTGLVAEVGALNGRQEFATRWRDLDTGRRAEVIQWLQHEFDVAVAGGRAKVRDKSQLKPLTRRSLNRALKFVKHENGKSFEVEPDSTGVLASNVSSEGIDILRECCNLNLGYGFNRREGDTDPQLFGGTLVALRELARERGVLVKSYGLDPDNLSAFCVRAELAFLAYMGAPEPENLKYGGPLARVMNWKDKVQVSAVAKNSPDDTLGVGLRLATIAQ